VFFEQNIQRDEELEDAGFFDFAFAQTGAAERLRRGRHPRM